MDQRVKELHCIMPIVNVLSVMQHGILSHERASALKHQSVALQAIQDKRDQIHVPGGLKLHQYANLYFNARNPMMFKRQSEAPNLCVLRISTEVLKLPGVVITDQNAASGYVRFLDPKGWMHLNFDDIFAMDWRHPGNPPAYYRHRAVMCAEVLVQSRVESRFIVGAYVADPAPEQKLLNVGFGLPIVRNPMLFFS